MLTGQSFLALSIHLRYNVDEQSSYVILLFAQPESFTPPSNLSTPGVPVSVFNLDDYVQARPLP